MEVILTHEHADFDAIASLLAAHKLNPKAVPVLPRKTNRNVRNFLTLYWDVLPFKRQEDIPRRSRINRVTLVDTQGLASLRGMVKKPKVMVVDHHARAADLDPSWTFEGTTLGAATTLLVERFPEAGVRLTAPEATLLLLGVYEDTGSLTYSATTSRDIRCAAWLIDRGADLNQVVQFLYHPLSLPQRELYQRLQEMAEVHQFEGQAVVIAAAVAEDYVEEISTLAHKMRDLYDPAALFLLVQLEQHIQLVARSTVDTINVGQIAAHFGGGGHERASAAIIRDQSLAAAREALLETLSDHVEPLTTVAQIMSHGVETFTPETTISEANERMRRLGYEGYPVVEGTKIVGLLTRRDIDRALQHKLGNAVVSRFMSPGEISVRPDDPVPYLQGLMMEHGWGQIPVVAPEDGQILGVVTRTDVIKLWEPRPVSDEREAVRARMARVLPAPILALVERVSQTAEEMGVQIYFVGGLVRDLFLEIPNMDVDIVVEGDAIALAKNLVEKAGGRARSHARFGTAKWLLEPGFWGQLGASPDEGNLPAFIDFVTARSEFYDHPTALPEVRQGSIKLDLHRRDFTINTLAIWLNPDRFGELLDFYAGKRDLDRGLIRVLHSLSFIDDPTRILRAVRFEQRLGFGIESRTEELLHQSISLLDRVTGDRIRHELELLLREPLPERGFARLDELGVLAQIHPALCFDAWAERAFRKLRQVWEDPAWGLKLDDYTVEFSYFGLLTFRMSLSALRVFQRRLRVRRETAEGIGLLHELKGHLSTLAGCQSASAAHQVLRAFPNRVLLVAHVATEDQLVRDIIDQHIHRWSKVKTITTGRDLREHGLKPGPVYRQILGELLTARLDGRISNQEEEQQLLVQLLAEHGHS